MSKFSVQTIENLDNAGADAPTRDRELVDRIVAGVRSLLGFVEGFVQDVRLRSTRRQRSSNAMRFEDRHSAAALIGLFGNKHG